MQVSVRVLDAPFHIDKPYTYLLPPGTKVQKGSLVRVPFGRGDREVWGVVTDITPSPLDAGALKPVLSVMEARYALHEELFGLCLFLSERYLCSFGDAVRTVMPHILNQNTLPHAAMVTYCALNLSHEMYTALIGNNGGLRSAAHRAILTYLKQNGRTERRQLVKELGVSSAQINAVAEKGFIKLTQKEVIRNPYADLGKERCTTPIYLTRAQQEAFGTLLSLYETHTPRGSLLHGVTGSGKTKIMLSLIDHVIADKKSAILMVPEIALTPQTVRIFCSRYGERVAVIHSSLSPGERFDAWRRIREGQVDLVIGTRSAVFAPLQNIGVIIIDEEHEHTYKSEQDPKYTTREVASYRAGVHNALMVLASATPSFESYYKAKKGDYTLVELTQRYGGNPLPTVEIVDMRKELRSGNLSPMSRRLFSLMEKTREAGKQSILFLNRRGYHASLQCKNCGGVVTCPHCSVAMTYHTQGGAKLLCHLCGTRQPVPLTCPTCGDARISYIGFGTQKVEGELFSQLSNSRVLRMDADTTSKREDYESLLDAFRRKEADILLGTQMVTKGHDFPDVTLVGVMLADTGMHVNDFRASERTFSLLTQVVGRAGRAKEPGVAVIQTFSPDSDVVQLAAKQDYVAFYEREIQLRKEMCFPPFCDMVQLTVSSEKEDKLKEATDQLLLTLKTLLASDYSHIPLQIFGPMEAHVYKMQAQYRLRLVCKCRWNKETRALFRTLLSHGWEKHRVNLQIDINPTHV